MLNDPGSATNARRFASSIYRRLLPLLVASALAAYVLLTDDFYQADGFLRPLGWFGVVCVLALLVLALSQLTPWQNSGVFFALALLAQASALQLVDAGQHPAPQHYVWWTELLDSRHAGFVAALLAITVVLALSVYRWRDRIGFPRRARSGFLPIALLLILMAFATVSVSPRLLRTVGELMLASWVVVVGALSVALAAAMAPPLAVTRSWDRFRDALRTPRVAAVFPWALACWVFVASVALNTVAFDRIPHIPDSVAYLFQAKYFAEGQLYLPAPADSGVFPGRNHDTSAFSVPHTINDGSKWYGIFPPGWPALLAMGVLLGAPWIVNPIIGAATILLVYSLIARLHHRGIAQATISLLALSPQFLAMSASFMSHPFALLCALLMFLGIERARTESFAWAVVGGVGLGALVLVRPIEGVLLGTIAGLWALGIAGTRLPVGRLLVFAAIAVGIGALLLPYHETLTGNALYDPITKYFDETYYQGSNRLGFGSEIGNVDWKTDLDPFSGHGLRDVVFNTNQNLYMLNFELFGWVFGSLWFAALFILYRRAQKADFVFVATLAVVIVGYSCYWFSGGPDIGARYWYQAIVPLTLLTVRGIDSLRRHRHDASDPTDARLMLFLALASLTALINVAPWRILDKYHHYHDMRADIRRLDRTHTFGNSLVLIRSARADHPFAEYASAFVFNPPLLTGTGTIYARDLGPDVRARLQASFPSRPVWVIEGSSLTGGAMRIAERPPAHAQKPDASPR